MTFPKLVFRVHAIQRMFDRHIAVKNVRDVLETGELIECYADDKPCPSYLVLGFAGPRPIHVVAANDDREERTVVITGDEPMADQWDSAFKRRKLQ